MREAAEQRNNWIAEEQERGDEGNQEQMLHHMGAQKCVCEAIKRRGDGEPDSSKTKQK
jgi:hypothetical protein